jgi:hypothetical protein
MLMLQALPNATIEHGAFSILSPHSEVTGSNFGPETDYSHGRCSFCPHYLQKGAEYLKWSHDHFNQFSFQFAIHYHPICRRYTTWGIASAVINQCYSPSPDALKTSSNVWSHITTLRRVTGYPEGTHVLSHFLQKNPGEYLQTGQDCNITNRYTLTIHHKLSQSRYTSYKKRRKSVIKLLRYSSSNWWLCRKLTDLS